MTYYRISENYNNNKLIPSSTSPYALIKDKNKPYFISMMNYNEEQYSRWKEKNSLAGEKGSTTNKLWADFDGGGSDKPNTELRDAFKDGFEFYKKLRAAGIEDSAIQISFSGNKGVGFIVETTGTFTCEEVKNICFSLAENLKTFDQKMYDNQRIFRLLFTKNEKTSLYKIPLTAEELENANIEYIKETAKSIDDFDIQEVTSYYTTTPVTNSIEKLKQSKNKPEKKESTAVVSDVLDFSKKPKFLTNCRWALQNGYFSEGSRSTAFLCLASTYKNLGFDLEHVYRMLKGTAELQSKRNDSDRFPDEELYNNIVTQVFSNSWNGGQYSCREEGNWLHNYCKSLGENACKHKEELEVSSLTNFSSKFKHFASNIERNTIKFGIQALDNRVMITTNMLVGLLGAPSAGKTQTVYEILNNTSNQGIDSMFFSMDMGLPLVYTRLIQKHFAISQDKVYSVYKTDPVKEKEIDSTLKEEYKNVNFCFKSGLTVPEIKDIVVDYEKNLGRKLKLIVIDYLECLSSQFSDSTASTALIAQQLKDLANETDTCVLVLLQTQKASGDPSEPLLSMRKIKGASSIEQACSVVFTISRPGFSAKNPHDDKFITISAVKNRMGSLMSVDCGFEGLTGKITYPLSDEDYQLLKEVRERKRQEKEEDGAGDGWG